MKSKLISIFVSVWILLVAINGQEIIEYLNSTPVDSEPFLTGVTCTDKFANELNIGPLQSITAHRYMGVGDPYLLFIELKDKEHRLYKVDGWQCGNKETPEQHLFASNNTTTIDEE